MIVLGIESNSIGISYLVNYIRIILLGHYSKSEDTIRVRTKSSIYNEDSIRVGTLFKCGLYLRVNGVEVSFHATPTALWPSAVFDKDKNLYKK